jgi:hypothetical protein
MTALYWVLISDELMEKSSDFELPEEMRFTRRAPVPPLPPYAQGTPAAAHWHQVEDTSAGPELEGRQVELVLGRRGRKDPKTVIIERRLLS